MSARAQIGAVNRALRCRESGAYIVRHFLEHIKEASDDRTKLATSSDFDNHPAVVGWPPFIWVVEGTYAHGVHHALRREDVVELGLRVCRRCPDPAEGWHVLAFPWQPRGPGIRLSAVGRLRSDALQAEGVHPVEDGLITGAPVGVAVLARTSVGARIPRPR